MAGSFPTGVTTYTNPGPNDVIGVDVGARTLDEFIADHSDDLEQVMTKVGTGASTASADTVMRGTGSGTTDFGKVDSARIADDTIVNADINSAAAINLSKIEHVGTGNVLKSNGTTNVGAKIVSADITDDTIMNADINAAAGILKSKLAALNIVNADVASNAAILLSKLEPGTSGFIKSNGTVISSGNALAATDIPADTITSTQLAADSVGNSELANDAVSNLNVVAGANIDLSKLNPGTSGVLKSNGSAISAGNLIAPADITPNSITAAELAPDSVGASELADNAVSNANVVAGADIALAKLQAGSAGFVKSNGTVISSGNAFAATDIPADTITSTQLGADCVGNSELADNAVLNANVDAAAAIVVSKLAAGGTANRVVATANGTTMAMQQIVAAMIADNVITATQLGPDCVGASELADNSVDTAAIQADAVTVKHVSPGSYSGAYTTGSTSLQIADMSFNITTDGTVPYLIGFQGTFTGSAAGGVMVFDLHINGATHADYRRQCTVTAAGQQIIIAFTFLLTPSTPGTYSVAMNFWMSGAGTIGTVATQRMIWAEKLLR